MQDDARAAVSGRRPRFLLGGLSLISFVLVLMDSALGVALPGIGRDLGLGLGAMQWIINSYTLSFAATVLVAGSLSDLLGARRVFMLGVALFCLASLLAAFSLGFGWLVAFRLAQGVGAALITPSALSLIIRGFAPPRLAVALGIVAGASTAALGLGPLVGAAVTEALGWRSLFLVSLFPGAVALALRAYALSQPEPRPQPGRFDVPGAVASGVGLTLVLFAVTEGSAGGWTTPRTVLTLLGGLLSLAAFVFVERRARASLLDLRVLRRPNVAAANAVGLLSTMVMCGVLVFLSLYFQYALGYAPLVAGLALLPLTAPLLVAAPLAGRLLSILGRRLLIAGGLGLLAVGLVGLSRAMVSQDVGLLLLALLVVGVGSGITVAPTTAAAVEAVEPERSGLVSGVFSTSRTIGLALGVSVMSALVVMDEPATGAGVPAGFVPGLSGGLVVYGIVAGATAVVALLTLRNGSFAPSLLEDGGS